MIATKTTLTIRVSALDWSETWNIYILSSYHEGDFLACLRLPADHEDAAAKDEKEHGQQRQAPHLHAKD